ncbi:MAG TPA: hypothetical protein DCG80_06530 [Idiomarina sp.]|jgi:hypothetical protein|uniref:hypothetical protein n=1 Tax=Idiomarina TaxID=135575 RepID=UPI0007972838|nr:hypothetical protein [Idiomarina sp. T82-3]KXS34738.1 MAG: hypothetical protein AWU56_1669 [Idiomarina sp. T82-3]MBL73931.1 hypothetical protein [Idiomarinaceae bacterium]HAE90630.1 hypothetical protein [Idiomarina sp.]|tara:strand:- start:288 stop:650 length:363 start_codon:yes stop_codon:yes gene_type:complete
MRSNDSKRLQKLGAWRRVMGTLSILGWLIFIAALIVYDYAKPETGTLLSEWLDVDLRSGWIASLAQLYLFLMALGLVVSCIACVLNIWLHRRRRTHIWVNTLILGLASISGLLLFFYGFS